MYISAYRQIEEVSQHYESWLGYGSTYSLALL